MINRILTICIDSIVTLLIGCILFVIWLLYYTSAKAELTTATIIEQYERVTIPEPTPDEQGVPIPNKEFVLSNVGNAIGLLIVPKWEGLHGYASNRMPILEGTTKRILSARAAGHYVTSALPGEIGNMALAGHRRAHGNSFRHIDMLKPGDPIIIQTKSTWYVYTVRNHEIVTPSQSTVLLPSPNQPGVAPTRRLLTLTTCHSPTKGEWGNSHRWIVYAELTSWMPTSHGIPKELTNV